MRIARQVSHPKQWLAVLVLWALFTGPALSSQTVWIDVAFGGLFFGIRLLVLIRVGLLAGVVAMLVFPTFTYPLTFDTTAWYASVGYVYLAVVAAITLYGFRTSLGGRPVLQLPGFAD